MLTLSELAIFIPATIDFFESYDFDYYQNGNITLKEACQLKNLEFNRIDAELNDWIKKYENKTFINFNELDISRLIGFLHKTYHSKEEELLQTISNLIVETQKNADQNDKQLNYQIRNIAIEFNKLKEKLLLHFDKEDRIFFPYIDKLLNAKNVNLNIPGIHISAIKNPIRILKHEHEEAMIRLHEIQTFTKNFEPVPEFGNSYNHLMQTLQHFTKEIHVHLHLENNVLFPKLLDLESFIQRKIKEKYY